MAAVDFFLKIDGIKGESVDDKHKDEITIESYSFGASNAGSFNRGGGGAAAGKVSMQDFHFVMRINKASPSLMLACAKGEHIKQAILIARKAGKGQQDFMKWTFTDLLISSYQHGGSSGDLIPTDQFSLSFAKIEIEYKPQRPDGGLDAGITAGWDLKANLPITPPAVIG
jgi:type VI secretion system secreted protein Hcp